MNTSAGNTTTASPAEPSLAGARAWFAQNGLTRTRENRWLGGVFAGAARRYGVNPLVMKLAGLTAVLVLTPLLYIALWILMPADPQGATL